MGLKPMGDINPKPPLPLKERGGENAARYSYKRTEISAAEILKNIGFLGVHNDGVFRVPTDIYWSADRRQVLPGQAVNLKFPSVFELNNRSY